MSQEPSPAARAFQTQIQREAEACRLQIEAGGRKAIVLVAAIDDAGSGMCARSASETMGKVDALALLNALGAQLQQIMQKIGVVARPPRVS